MIFWGPLNTKWLSLLANLAKDLFLLQSPKGGSISAMFGHFFGFKIYVAIQGQCMPALNPS